MFIMSDTESNLVIRWRCYFRYRHHIMDAIYACVNTDTTIVKIMSTTPSPWRSDLTDRDQRAAGECHLMVIRRSPRPSLSLATNRPTESSPFLLPACSSGPFPSSPSRITVVSPCDSCRLRPDSRTATAVISRRCRHEWAVCVPQARWYV